MSDIEHTEERPTNTAERLLAEQHERDRFKDVAKENFEEYKTALNGMAATPNGQLVLKTWIKAFGIFTVKPSRDGVALVGDKALRDFYLTLVRPNLDVSLRHEIES